MNLLNLTIEENIATIELNREASLHALNSSLIQELTSTFQQLEKSVQVVLLTGKGEKAFCTGADIEEMSHMNEEEIVQFIQSGHTLMNTIATYPIPVIAVVNGYALGGGLELALACDFILASEKAKLGLPETTLGLIPGFGGTVRLTEALGRRKAKELIFSGKILQAKEAQEMGFVNRIFPPNELLSKSIFLAKKIAKNPDHAVQAAKKTIDDSYEPCLNAALEREQKAFSTCFQSKETKNILDHFTKKSRHAKSS